MSTTTTKAITTVNWLSFLLLFTTILSLLSSTTTTFAQPVTTKPIQLHGLNYNTRKGADWYAYEDRCKSRSEVVTELNLLKQITNRIRILSLTDCNQAAVVLDVIQNDVPEMQVWLGMWVSNGADDDFFYQELSFLETLLQEGRISPDKVLGITVGSEAVYRGDITVQRIIIYKNLVSDLMTQYGVQQQQIPVAICDIDDIYQQYTDLFAATDVVFANAFPFWENFVSVDQAADYLVNQKIEGVLNNAAVYNKPFILGETGWSAAGSNPAANVASPENQVRFFQDFYCAADIMNNWAYYYFTGIDNTWRMLQADAQVGGVEGHFGIFYDYLVMKPQFQDLVFTCPDDPYTQYRFILDGNADTFQATDRPSIAPVIATPLRTIQETPPPQLGREESYFPSQSPTIGTTATITSPPSPIPTLAPSYLISHSNSTNTTPTPSVAAGSERPSIVRTSGNNSDPSAAIPSYSPSQNGTGDNDTTMSPSSTPSLAPSIEAALVDNTENGVMNDNTPLGTDRSATTTTSAAANMSPTDLWFEYCRIITITAMMILATVIL